MPFYDLNLPWSENYAELERALSFLHELGYDVVALSHTLSGKPPTDLTCPIPNPLPFPTPPKLKILRRCTIVASDPSHNHRLSDLSRHYDLLAIRPTDERTLLQACQSPDADLISLDMTMRYPFHFKFGTLALALQSGMKLEICYSQGIMGDGGDAQARRNLIQNATGLIRACRGRGVVVSSEARRAVGLRAPMDVANLVTVWGLNQEKGREAVTTAARSVVVSAAIKRSSYRGVIDVVYGGEKASTEQGDAKTNKGKRKAGDNAGGGLKPPEQLSRRERKRQAQQAKNSAQTGQSRPSAAKGAVEEQGDVMQA